MKFCTSCGARLDVSIAFCSGCGAKTGNDVPSKRTDRVKKQAKSPKAIFIPIIGVLLIVVILGIAFSGGIGGLIDNLLGRQEVDVVATPPSAQSIEAMSEPIPTPPPSRYVVGDIIQFGNYDWRVLDVQGNQALIIADRIIYHRTYHHTLEVVTWEASEIRQWLNGDFFASFSPANQARIAETYVINNDNPWDFSEMGGWINTPGGNYTTDRIFLLSIDEVLRYFGDSGLVARGAVMGCNERDDNSPNWPELGIYWWGIMDQYREARIAHDLGGSASWWWLRSPGFNPFVAALIDHYGFLLLSGVEVSTSGGVRPALWLYMDAMDTTPPNAQMPAPETALTPTPIPIQMRYTVGDIIQFGNYDWRVLDVQGNQALIIADRIIATRWYHHTFDAVTWETSEIRQWLNGDFFASFSPANQARIVETYVINNNNPWDFSDWGGYANTPGGSNTIDRIFLLSIDEVLRYFGDSGLVARGSVMGAIERDESTYEGLWGWAIFDQYSGARIAHDLGGSSSWWWLRSPGVFSDRAAIVVSSGHLFLDGFYVFMSGGNGGGVRPALWLNLDS